jgi:Domain of unknown function (DUF222)
VRHANGSGVDEELPSVVVQVYDDGVDVDLLAPVALTDREPPDEPDCDQFEAWDAAVLALLGEVEADGVEVASHPMGSWGYEDLVQVIADAERASRAAIARGMLATAELSRRLPGGGWIADATRAREAGVSEFAAVPLGMAMGVSQKSADIRLHEALALDDRLPRTLAALAAGIVGMPAVRVLVAETTLLDAAGAGEVESRVLNHLGGKTHPDLGRSTPAQISALPVAEVARMAGFATSTVVRRVARRAVTQIDADAVRQRLKAAPLGRRIDLTPSYAGDGMAWVGSFLTEARAWAAYARVCGVADRSSDPEDPRTVEQVRADVFYDLLMGVPHPSPAGDPDDDDPDDPGHDDPGHDDPRGSDPGGSDNGARVPWSGPVGVPVNLTILIDAQGVAEAPGYGPIPRRTVDALIELSKCTGGTVKTVVVDPVSCPGHPAGGPADPHDPPPGMRRAVQLRDLTCVFPGCATAATRCDLDHTVPWPHGPTCPCNLGPLCRRHHRLKTHDPGWTLTNHGDGSFTWTTPWGATYEATSG